MAAMGSFRIDIEIENPARRGERRKVRHAFVDTGAELSWVPGDVLRSLGIEPMKQWSFRQATGQIIERWVGPVLIYAADTVTSDDVVFGEPGDLVLLGARTLEGLNVRVEPREKRLVDAMLLAAAAHHSDSLGVVGSSLFFACAAQARRVVDAHRGDLAAARRHGATMSLDDLNAYALETLN